MSIKDVLISARSEILSLRRENEMLFAKVSVMELMGEMLRARQPDQSRGAGIDIAWQIQREIEGLGDKENIKS